MSFPSTCSTVYGRYVAVAVGHKGLELRPARRSPKRLNDSDVKDAKRVPPMLKSA